MTYRAVDGGLHNWKKFGIMIIYRRAIADDYPGILKLQSANYLPNVPPQDRSQGFLSAEFTPGQVAAIAQDLGIAVAAEGEAVAGYLCSLRNDFEHGSAVLEKMLGSYDRLHFKGRKISSYQSYIYGPVCIAQIGRASCR